MVEPIGKKKVMIFSENPQFREIVYLVLSGKYEVHMANTLRDIARKVTGGIIPDLYIVDHDNSQMSGCRIVGAIRREYPQAKYMMVANTVAYDLGRRKEVVEPCGCSNADAYLERPYKGIDLEKKVLELVKTTR